MNHFPGSQMIIVNTLKNSNFSVKDGPKVGGSHIQCTPAYMPFKKNLSPLSSRNGVSTSSDDLTLTSLKELHDKFDVVGPGDEPVATEMASEHAQQVKLLADIIVAVLSCVELEGYDSYKTFKLFESFPEV